MTWAKLLRFWWALPIAGLLILLSIRTGQRDDARLTLKNERQAFADERDRADRQRIDTERRYADRISTAALNYADRLAAREPIILKSTNTVREYAKTDAGRVLCRGADRVRAIDALDAELAEDARPAGGGAGALRADTAAPSG